MLTLGERDLDFTSSIIAGLMYRGSGTTQTLFALTEKVLDHLHIRLDAAQLQLLNRLLLNRLRLFGFVETIRRQKNNNWVVAPNRFLKYAPGRFFVLGNRGFIDSAKLLLSDDNWTVHSIYQFPGSVGANLTLSVNEVNTTSERIEIAAKCTDGEFQKIADIFQFLPNIHEVFERSRGRQTVSAAIAASIEIQEFDFDDFQWVNADPRSIVSGLYRIPHVYGSYQHLLFKQVSRELIGFRLHEQEWSIFVGAHLLNVELMWRYAPGAQVLSIPAKQIPFIPSLVKKAILTKAFRWPDLSLGHYHAGDVTPDDSQHLASLFPMLGICYV